MSFIGDIVDRMLFPNREIHVIPVLDGAFSPNQRLDQARQLGEEIERPDDLALGPDGALYVSSGNAIIRCSGADFGDRAAFARFATPVGGLGLDRRPSPDRLRLEDRVSSRCRRPGRRSASSNSALGEPIACPTSVAVASDGAIYATDGSRANPPEVWLPDLMQNRPPSGRLIACDPQSERRPGARGQARLAFRRRRLARRRRRCGSPSRGRIG